MKTVLLLISKFLLSGSIPRHILCALSIARAIDWISESFPFGASIYTRVMQQMYAEWISYFWKTIHIIFQYCSACLRVEYRQSGILIILKNNRTNDYFSPEFLINRESRQRDSRYITTSSSEFRVTGHIANLDRGGIGRAATGCR
jgi:hypothetical protein